MSERSPDRPLPAQIAAIARAWPEARLMPRRADHPICARVGQLRQRIDSPLPGLKARASTGRAASWANVPWIAWMDPGETQSAQDGRYLALLWHGDGAGATLALAWGTQRLRRRVGAGAREAIAARRARGAADLEAGGPLEAAGFVVDAPVDLGARTQLARDYEASCLAHISWTVAQLEALAPARWREAMGALARAYEELLRAGEDGSCAR